MSEGTDFSPSDTEDEHPLSLFALHLASPIITLCVGEPQVEFHVHEDRLRELLFFQVISDEEYTKGSVDMPEDEPEAVAALIRWLYQSRYEYNMNQLQEKTLKLREVPEDASNDLLEGLFHLEVCIVASKYQCMELFRHAQDQFNQTFVKLEPIDGLRLWNAEINSGPPGIYLLPLDVSFPRALRKWVRKLFNEHHTESYEIMRRSPELCIRILHWCTLIQVHHPRGEN